MDSIFFLVLRRMRAPLIVLIVIYAVSVLGLTLVPGVTAEGQPAPPMSFFHAFYFISYTATTIGFGEIPVAFSEAQRLWVVVCIYLTVIGWSYSILTLLALFQDRLFQQTLVATRFTRRVQRLRTPFTLICGCGETGGLICRTFDHLGRSFVVIEQDEQRVQELDLEDFKTDTPTLAADARLPANLIRAGITHPRCQGVLAVTNDETTNLAITVTSNLLNPGLPVISRARTALTASHMRAFGRNHVIDAYERFAEHLALAIAAPARFHLIELLTGLPDAPLPVAHRPPGGHWIVCGYGQFGRAVVRHLAATGITPTIIDPVPPAPDDPPHVCGQATDPATLQAAGLAQAQGIVAGSNDDVTNLAIATIAKALRPDLFVVLRQNHAANRLLFEKFHADFTMVQSRIVAQESIAILTTPLLEHFLAHVRQAGAGWCTTLTERIEACAHGRIPVIWDLTVNSDDAPALQAILAAGETVTLGDWCRDHQDRQQPADAVVLMLQRGDTTQLLPDPGTALAPGDRLLLASRRTARRTLELTSRNAKALHYVRTGQDQPAGWLWQRLFPSR